jgi:hypothetical protein
MQQLNHLGGDETLGGPQLARLAFLMAKFKRAVRLQRQQDTANLASLLRALQRGGPDAETLCRLINLRAAGACAAAAADVTRYHDEDQNQG